MSAPASTSPSEGRPRRLFVYGARIGDLVLVTPLLRVLAAQGPLELLGRPWARDLFAGRGPPSAVHVLRRPAAPAWTEPLRLFPRARLGRRLAARRFDEIVVFAGEHPRVRAWIDAWRGPAAVRAITFKPSGPLAHRTAAQRRALRDAGFDDAAFDPTPRLEVAPPAVAAARERLATYGRRVVLAQVGSSATIGRLRRRPHLKGLAPAQWAAFFGGVLARDEADAVVFLGTAPEAREASAVRAAMPPALRARTFDATGAVPLRDLPALCAAAHAVASIDTGPAHVAAAVGRPLLVVFGPTDPRVFAPTGPGVVEIVEGAAPCRPCHGTPAMKACRANVCLASLPAATLDDAWRRLLARAAAATS